MISRISSANCRGYSSGGTGHGERVSQAVGGGAVGDPSGGPHAAPDLFAQAQGDGAGSGDDEGVEVHSDLSWGEIMEF